jgi:hypothetical protein
MDKYSAISTQYPPEMRDFDAIASDGKQRASKEMGLESQFHGRPTRLVRRCIGPVGIEISNITGIDCPLPSPSQQNCASSLCLIYMRPILSIHFRTFEPFAAIAVLAKPLTSSTGAFKQRSPPFPSSPTLSSTALESSKQSQSSLPQGKLR